MNAPAYRSESMKKWHERLIAHGVSGSVYIFFSELFLWLSIVSSAIISKKEMKQKIKVSATHTTTWKANGLQNTPWKKQKIKSWKKQNKTKQNCETG